jgi:hypothetical protein
VVAPLIGGQLRSEIVASDSMAIMALSDEKRIEERQRLAEILLVLGTQIRASASAISLCLTAVSSNVQYMDGPRGLPRPQSGNTLFNGQPVKAVRQQLAGLLAPHTNFKGVDLNHADLVRAQLFRCDFMMANLVGTNMQGARLKGAAFLSANLEHADLAGADVTDAMLGGAYIENASLEKCKWWDANFDGFFKTSPDSEDVIDFDRTLIDRLFAKFGDAIPLNARRHGNQSAACSKYIQQRLERNRPEPH